MIDVIKITAANQTIAKEVAETLNKHYPGHAWAVMAEVENGIVKVYNLRFSGQWGFVVHMDDMINDPEKKIIIRAGGELLERYNISRGALKEAEINDIIYDFKGDAIGDKS